MKWFWPSGIANREYASPCLQASGLGLVLVSTSNKQLEASCGSTSSPTNAPPQRRSTKCRTNHEEFDQKLSKSIPGTDFLPGQDSKCSFLVALDWIPQTTFWMDAVSSLEKGASDCLSKGAARDSPSFHKRHGNLGLAPPAEGSYQVTILGTEQGDLHSTGSLRYSNLSWTAIAGSLPLIHSTCTTQWLLHPGMVGG